MCASALLVRVGHACGRYRLAVRWWVLVAAWWHLLCVWPAYPLRFVWQLYDVCMCVFVCVLDFYQRVLHRGHQSSTDDREFGWDILCMGSTIQRHLKPVTNTDEGIGSACYFLEHSIDKLDPWKRTNLSSANQCKSMIYLITWSTVHCREPSQGNSNLELAQGGSRWCCEHSFTGSNLQDTKWIKLRAF